MTISKLSTVVMLSAAAGPPLANAIELQPATIKAWEEYVRDADQHMRERVGGAQPFLWTDESAERIARVRRGEVVIEPAAGSGMRSVPNGLIHHWVGAVFIPNAGIEGVFRVIHDYARYKDIYKPVVARSQAAGCSLAAQEFSMVWRHKVLFVNAAIESEYRAYDVTVNARQGYNIADSARVREIQDYGRPTERLLAPGAGNGFIWRLHSIARYEERDGGTYLEWEAIALTRDIPASLRWLVSPTVNHVSIHSLATTLRQTRDAVHSLPVAMAAVCPNHIAVAASSKSGGEY